MSAPPPSMTKCDPKILRTVPATERRDPHRDRTVVADDDLEKWMEGVERKLFGEDESGPSGSPRQDKDSKEPEEDAGDPEEEEEGEQGFGELSAEGASVFFPDRPAQAASSATNLSA